MAHSEDLVAVEIMRVGATRDAFTHRRRDVIGPPINELLTCYRLRSLAHFLITVNEPIGFVARECPEKMALRAVACITAALEYYKGNDAILLN